MTTELEDEDDWTVSDEINDKDSGENNVIAWIVWRADSVAKRFFLTSSATAVQKRNKTSPESRSDVLLCNLNHELIEHVDFENMNLSSDYK
jgi:hypothetical protein